MSAPPRLRRPAPAPVAEALGRWLLTRGPVVRAVGLGLRQRGGVILPEPVAVVLVDRKRPPAALGARERVPPQLFGLPTDVRSSGPFAGTATRSRPAPGGVSVGHFRGESGTLACRAWEPGRPDRGLLLSNNHVLTRFNRAAAGDAIIQPAQAALGYAPRDTVGALLRWAPLDIDPPVPAEHHDNPVDAAVAVEATPGLISPEIRGLGAVGSWRAVDDLPVGLPVVKSGAVSGVTWGQVTVLHATARLNFHGVGTAVMREQILTTHLTEGGDSGALVLARDGEDGWSAIGLACGASRQFSMVNPIAMVQDLLTIRVAQRQWTSM